MPFLTRRAFLGASLAAIAGGSCIYAYGIESHWLDVVRLEMPLPWLPDAFADFSIAQISDLHFGPLVKPSHMGPVVQAVMDLGADAIVITGDLVSGVNKGEPDMIVQCLSALRAPHGVFAVLGNHDLSNNGFTVTRALRRAGISVLRNEHFTWQSGSSKLYLMGIDDVCGGMHDLGAALDGIPSDASIIALVHEPDYADIVANHPRVLLQLSGHSHGGQVCLPFYGGLYFPRWARKYPSGMYHIQDLTLYTNRGVGVMALPMRFACRPEITLFTLKPAQSSR